MMQRKVAKCKHLFIEVKSNLYYTIYANKEK